MAKPKPKHLKVSEIARRDGVTSQAVSKRIRKQNVKRGPRDTVDAADYERAIRAGMAARAEGPASQASARDQYWRAKAALTVMDAQERQGKLIPKEEVDRILTDMATAIKNDLLALPNALAGQVEGLPAGEVAVKLRAAVLDVLRHLGGRAKE